MKHSFRPKPLFAALWTAFALQAPLVYAADITITPPSGSNVVINGGVVMPGLPSAAQKTNLMCFDANGVLGNCTAGISQGATGATGPTGTAGTAGATGATGPTGTAGTPGAIGPTGAAGTPGAIGPTGAAGTPGAIGPTGATGPGITWVNVTGTTQQAVSNTGYMANNAAQVTIILPASPAVGDIIQVNGIGAGGWKIAQNSGQSTATQAIVKITGATTTGTINGGQYDAIELQYIGSNKFSVLNFAGNVGAGGYVYEGGLTWMPPTQITYAAAVALCATTINGVLGWRLPTLPELSALYSRYPNTASLPITQGWADGYTWSSMPGNPGDHYVVLLSTGNVGTTGDTGSYEATCVR